MLIAKKVLNNSIILALDDEGRELLIRGKGIGFNIKPHQELYFDKPVSIQYVTEYSELFKAFEQVPKAYINLGQSIFEIAEKELNKTLSPILSISLADHIYGASIRKKQLNLVSNVLQHEIPRVYPQEYKVALKSLELIFKKTGIRFLKSEATIITMHIINAEY